MSARRQVSPISSLLIAISLLLISLQGSDALYSARGFVITSDNTNLNQTTVQLIQQLQTDLHLNWISLNIHLHQPTPHSSLLTRSPKTPTNASFTYFLTQMAHLNIKVLLKVLITVDGTDNGWLSILPDQPSAWFSSYLSLLSEFIELSNESSPLASLCIGTELLLLSKSFPEEWVALIGNLRTVFGGELTYAALVMELSGIQFWGMLDLIGIEAYLPFNATPADVSPPVGVMMEVASSYYLRIYGWQQEAGLGHLPVFFTETGFSSYTGVAASPWRDPEESCVGFVANGTAQQYAYEALFGALHESPLVVDGVFIFHLDLPSNADYYGPPPNSGWSCGFTPRGKPAYLTIGEGFNN